MKYKVKIITGFNNDQKYTIDADEVHKAYYLFRNPEKRGVFNSGLALIGKDIRAIQPDYHATMGWNDTHKLDDDDWNQLNGLKVVEKIKEIMGAGNMIAYKIDENPSLMTQNVSEIVLEAPRNTNELMQGINKLI